MNSYFHLKANDHCKWSPISLFCYCMTTYCLCSCLFQTYLLPISKVSLHFLSLGCWLAPLEDWKTIGWAHYLCSKFLNSLYLWCTVLQVSCLSFFTNFHSSIGLIMQLPYQFSFQISRKLFISSSDSCLQKCTQ